MLLVGTQTLHTAHPLDCQSDTMCRAVGIFAVGQFCMLSLTRLPAGANGILKLRKALHTPL